MKGIVRLTGIFLLTVPGLAMSLLPPSASAALPRYVDAAGFIRGTARSLEPVPGHETSQSAEAVAGACLDALAGSQGRDALVQAQVNAHGTFQLTPEQRELFQACLRRAGYQVRPRPPLPPGGKRFD